MQSNSNDLNLRCRRNKKQLFIWSLAWVLTQALATFGPKFVWDYHTLLSILAVGFNVLMGGGMILANIRFIKGLDELQQRIHMEAMGITLGVVLVLGIAYATLDTVKLIPFDAEIGFLILIMGVTYLLSLFVCTRRYG